MYSVDVSEQNFRQEVLEKSKTVPVVVDFWAPWCGPCQVLKPLLEKLAEEYQGKFILAKINADNNQALSAQFGVRGIPSVKAIFDGKIINEFSGALPEPAVREFLDKLIPSESEITRQSAMACYEQGNTSQAMDLLDKAIALDDNNYSAKIDRATLLVINQEFETASQLLQALPINIQQDSRVQELTAKIEIAQRISKLPDKASLIKRIETDSSDMQARLDLANHYIAEQNYDDAFEFLFDIISRDRNFGDDIARKTLLDIFTLLGSQDPRVRSARKKLASLLN